MEIGKRIRALREAAELSQEALARRADMSVTGLARIEQGGITDPRLSTLRGIAKGLDMSVSELLRFQD